MAKHQAKSPDVNQPAERIVSQTTGDAPNVDPPQKNQAAVEFGRRGGLKGWKALAAKLSAKKRQEIAKKAAKVRLDSKRS